MPAPQEFHDSILYLTSVENAVSLPSFPVSDWNAFREVLPPILTIFPKAVRNHVYTNKTFYKKIGCKSKIKPGNTSSPNKFRGDSKTSIS
jgi:hypothetical protein